MDFDDQGPEVARDAARRLVARVAYLLFERRLTELQGGNMSVRVGRDEVAVTPTLASENDGWRLSAADCLVQDLDGAVRAGDPKRVSRETDLHLRLYRAFPDVGSVFHLHLPEALAATVRWSPGVVAATAEPFGVPLCLLEPGLPAQTEPHNARVQELLGQVPRSGGAISISPTHGIVAVAPDAASNVRAVEVLRQRLEHERVRARLRRALERTPA